MNSKPPRLAMWFLKHFGCSPSNDAVTGDLVEQYQLRQSPTWFWKQVVIAVISGFYGEVSANKLLMLRSIFVGWVAYVASETLVFWLFNTLLDAHVFQVVTSLSAFDSFEWLIIYRLTLTPVVCGSVSGRIAAAVGRRHSRMAVFSYALTFIIVLIVIQLAGMWVSYREPEPWMMSLTLALHIPTILVGGLWKTSLQVTGLKEQHQ